MRAMRSLTAANETAGNEAMARTCDDGAMPHDRDLFDLARLVDAQAPLIEVVAPEEPLFGHLLEAFYDGERGAATLAMLD